MSIRATSEGIHLEKHAIKALLAFCGDDHRFDHVHFRISGPGDELIVNATDGHRACEAISTTEDPNSISGEWAVGKDFLSACYRACENDQSILMRVRKSGLRTASILETASMDEIGAITWAGEAASTRVTMSAISEILRIAKDARTLIGSWYAVQGRYLADLKLITLACGAHGAVTIYPPASPESAIGFEAEGLGVRWTGAVMPVRVEGPGQSLVDDEENAPVHEEHGETVAGAVDELRQVLGENGSMTLTVEGQESVTVKGKRAKAKAAE